MIKVFSAPDGSVSRKPIEILAQNMIAFMIIVATSSMRKKSNGTWRKLNQMTPAVIGKMGIQPLYWCEKIWTNCASILATRKGGTASSSSWRARRNECRNQWSAIFPHHVGDRHKRNDNRVRKSCMGLGRGIPGGACQAGLLIIVRVRRKRKKYWLNS